MNYQDAYFLEKFTITFLAIIVLFSIAYSVFMTIVVWKIYKKAGKYGWAALELI